MNTWCTWRGREYLVYLERWRILDVPGEVDNKRCINTCVPGEMEILSEMLLSGLLMRTRCSPDCRLNQY